MKTLLIAASNSDRVTYPDEVVDLRCTGENDGVQINAFLAAHPGRGVEYAPGWYSIQLDGPAEGEHTPWK